MQHLEVSGAVGPIYGSLGVKRLSLFSSHPRLYVVPHPEPAETFESVYTLVIVM